MDHPVAEIISETIVPASTATPVPTTDPHHPAKQSSSTSSPNVQFRMASTSAADDSDFVTRLRDIVNQVYLETEGDIFVDGYQRVSTEELREIIRSGELAVAYAMSSSSSLSASGPAASTAGGQDQAVVAIGCMRIHVFPDSSKAQLGMLAVDPAHRGSGMGREMMTFAASYCRSELGLTTLQLETLAPIESEHAFKKRLQGWYERMGFGLVRLGVFADDYPKIAPLLRGPTEYRVFEKALV